LFSTGDEIAKLYTKKKKFQIYDVNKYLLISLFSKVGCEVVDLGIIADDLEKTKKLILKSKKYDLLVTSGGVSKSSTTDNVSKIMVTLWGSFILENQDKTWATFCVWQN
jgi:molybdopterin molybdotransferase